MVFVRAKCAGLISDALGRRRARLFISIKLGKGAHLHYAAVWLSSSALRQTWHVYANKKRDSITGVMMGGYVPTGRMLCISFVEEIIPRVFPARSVLGDRR